MPQERANVTKFMNNPVTVIGPELKAGDKAPDFVLADNDLKPFSLADAKGKVTIISCVPSLDTPVCDLETRRFNKEAAAIGDIRILTVSMDLPFAQKRWCGAAGVEKVKTLSDYRGAAFGQAYGALIKELYLLARAIFVLDKEGIIRYVRFTDDVTQEPDYNAAIEAAKKLV
jgi:thiol peroxidase